MSNSLISVVIPCYNHEEYVIDCIKSILEQDYNNIELIIIDDGSRDESVKRILQYLPDCEKRFVRFEFRTRKNIGLCGTLNEALEWCKGKYCAIIASDDVMKPDRISRQIETFLDKIKLEPNLVAIYSGVEMIDSTGKKLKLKYGSGRFSGFKEVFLRTEFLPTPTCIVLTEKLRECGGFNPDYMIEDLFIRLRLTAAGGKFFTMIEPLVKYRQHSDNMSGRSDLIWKGVQDILNDYSSNKLYTKALARSMMIQAHDYQRISKTKSLLNVRDAFSNDPTVLFSMSMVKYIIKLLLPRKK